MCICLKIERPCQAVFGLLSCSSTFPPSVFPLSRLISPSPYRYPLFFPSSPSRSAANLQLASFLPISPRSSCQVGVLLSCAVPLPRPPRVELAAFLCFSGASRQRKGELWRCLTLQRDECRAASALNSSQCCAVMQTSMRASRERERGLSENVQRE